MMLNLKALLLWCMLAAALAEDSAITKFMKHLEVVPDVVDEGPIDFLKIVFNSGVEADKGVELTPTQVKDQPSVKWEAQPDALYTLIMTDPDAPSRADPFMREWIHWLVGNIPGDQIALGDVLNAFISSGPPKDSGLHRYVLLVYKQPKKLKFDEQRRDDTTAVGREKFSTKNFVEKYGLGVPVAGNFYQAQYDDYVLEVYKRVGLN